MKVTISKDEVKAIVAKTIKDTMGMEVEVTMTDSGDAEFTTSFDLTEPVKTQETSKGDDSSVLDTITDKVTDIFK